MKILVISDTHNRHVNLEKLFAREKDRDLVIHLGDAEGCEDEIAMMAACPLEIVAGNCDFFSSLCQEKILEIGRYKILITHGHYYNVNAGIEDMKQEAKSRGCDIVMFGHTHRPLLDYSKNIIAVNPGSVSYPRQEGKQPSYIVMEIDEKGDVHFEIKNISYKK